MNLCAVPEFAGTSSFGMSGVNAHAIIQHTPAELLSAGLPTSWQKSMRCFVDVLVALHPLIGVAFKVSLGRCCLVEGMAIHEAPGM